MSQYLCFVLLTSVEQPVAPVISNKPASAIYSLAYTTV